MSRILGSKIGCLSCQRLWTGQALEWTSIQQLNLFLLLNWLCPINSLPEVKSPSFQLFKETLKNVHTLSCPSSSLLLSLPPRFLFSQPAIDFHMAYRLSDPAPSYSPVSFPVVHAVPPIPWLLNYSQFFRWAVLFLTFIISHILFLSTLFLPS